MIEKFDAFHDTQNGIDNQQLTHCFMSARALVKLNDLIDTVNRLEESVQGVVNNSIKDGAYIQNLKEDVNSLRDDCNLLMGYIAPENGCELTDEDLRDMIKDPKYWKEQDPETVHKVEEGFRKLYGDKGGKDE